MPIESDRKRRECNLFHGWLATYMQGKSSHSLSKFMEQLRHDYLMVRGMDRGGRCNVSCGFFRFVLASY